MESISISDATSHHEVTLSQAKQLIKNLAGRHSLLLLSPPGVGKSEAVAQVATSAGLPCRSLLGTQIAPEDVSGIPRIVGERSVFCPPRVLLPETPEPFCLFLDELPACTPDIQKAFYSLLLERRLGEHPLPPGTWVVAAGNRAEDRALVRSLSSALVNRVFIMNVRVDLKEWLAWGSANGIRPEILSFLAYSPDSLLRPASSGGAPFSTPRAWASLSDALGAVAGENMPPGTLTSLVFGRVSSEDASVFSTLFTECAFPLRPLADYIRRPAELPEDGAARWFILHALRDALRGRAPALSGLKPREVCRFPDALPEEHRMALLVGLVREWGRIGASESLLRLYKDIVAP